MKTIFTMRGIAIACVVLGHAIGWVYLTQSWYFRDQAVAAVGSPITLRAEETPAYQALHGIKQLTLFDVPAFLFASGFLLAVLTGKEGKIGYKAVSGWIRGLFLPFMIWLAINSLGGWLPLYLFGSSPAPSFLTEVDATLRFLYFIPLIIQFYLLSPLITRMAQTDWKKLLLIAGALHLANTGLWYVQKLGLSSAEWINYVLYYNAFVVFAWALYFPLGTVCGLNFKKIKPVLQRQRMPLLAVAAVSGILSLVEMYLFSSEGGVLVPTVNSLSSIVYAISVTGLLLSLGDYKIPHQKQWMNMGTRSLGIYLSHTLVLVTVARALYHLTPTIIFQPFLLLLILFSLAMILPYLFGELLFRHARTTLYPILFG